MTSTTCLKCKHYQVGVCEAFPDEIPIDIWHGENNHKKPLPEQDNDIVFTPIDEDDFNN